MTCGLLNQCAAALPLTRFSRFPLQTEASLWCCASFMALTQSSSHSLVKTRRKSKQRQACINPWRERAQAQQFYVVGAFAQCPLQAGGLAVPGWAKAGARGCSAPCRVLAGRPRSRLLVGKEGCGFACHPSACAPPGRWQVGSSQWGRGR